MPSLMIIIASTRPGRGGEAVAEWFVERAHKHDGFTMRVVDLAELNLPFLDEPNHPRLKQYTKPHTRKWSAQVDAADAFVFVTPEYNYGYPAPLKNAIDFLHQEWSFKPLGFVTYGGVAAGTRSMQQLVQVVSALHMTPVSPAVNLPFYSQFRDDEGRIQPNETMNDAAAGMLDELARVEHALRGLRSAADATEA